MSISADLNDGGRGARGIGDATQNAPRVLINAVTYMFPKDQADRAARLLRDLTVASRREPGCISYEVARGIEDPCVFVLHERWTDRTALDAHYATEHFRRLGVDGIRTMASSRAAILAEPLPEAP